MKMEWKKDAVILVHIRGGVAVISANRDGLLSLADHLTVLAAETPGSHIHYDENNALEPGSDELIMELI